MSFYKEGQKPVKILSYYGANVKSFKMEIHRHPRCEIMYVVNGNCTVGIAGEKFEMKPGYFVFIDEDVPHYLKVAEEKLCTILNLEFAHSFENDGIDLDELKRKSRAFTSFLREEIPYKFLFDQKSRMCGAMKDMITYLSDNGEKESCMEDLLFKRVLLEMSYCCGSKPNFMSGAVYLNKARKFIELNFDRDISVSQVAEASGVNRSYLCSLFSGRYGCGIKAYINNKRLDKSCFLLKNSKQSITEIAFAVGYNSRQEFGYNFEKRYQMSPLQYRREAERAYSAEIKSVFL